MDDVKDEGARRLCRVAVGGGLHALDVRGGGTPETVADAHLGIGPAVCPAVLEGGIATGFRGGRIVVGMLRGGRHEKASGKVLRAGRPAMRTP